MAQAILNSIIVAQLVVLSSHAACLFFLMALSLTPPLSPHATESVAREGVAHGVAWFVKNTFLEVRPEEELESFGDTSQNGSKSCVARLCGGIASLSFNVNDDGGSKQSTDEETTTEGDASARHAESNDERIKSLAFQASALERIPCAGSRFHTVALLDAVAAAGVDVDAPEDLDTLVRIEADVAPECRPCAWLYKPSGCKNGEQCHYCHTCPDGEIKLRKKLKVACLRAQEKQNRKTIQK